MTEVKQAAEQEIRPLERLRNVALAIGGLSLVAFTEFPSRILAEIGTIGVIVGAIAHVTDRIAHPKKQMVSANSG